MTEHYAMENRHMKRLVCSCGYCPKWFVQPTRVDEEKVIAQHILEATM